MRLLRLLVVLLAAATLAGCGSDETTQTGTGRAASSGGAEPGAFPVTIPHRYGETTIDAEPERIVVAGLREQDALLSLGVVPVGTTEWYGEYPGAIFPWAKSALGGSPLPEKLDFTDGLQFERIAALRPDVIVAVYSGLTKADYDKLSAIAPTVAMPKGEVDWGSSWQEELATVGQIVGRPKAAAEVQATAEAELQAAADEHPVLKGKTGVVATPYNGIYVYGPQDARTRLLGDLGMRFPDALRSVAKDDFGGQLSEERIDLLDQGVVLWFADPKPQAKLVAGPYGKLGVHEQGRDVFLPEKTELAYATSFISPLSIPYLAEELVPKLAAAAEGNAQTPS